jgi:ATP-dependent DNA helicase DinG
LSYLIPGIAIAREEQKTLVVSTANVAAGSNLQQRPAAAAQNHSRPALYRRLWPRALRLPA